LQHLRAVPLQKRRRIEFQQPRVEAPGVAEIAEILSLSNTTIKAHLRALFAKTGTTRQAELVKLVAKFASRVG